MHEIIKIHCNKNKSLWILGKYKWKTSVYTRIFIKYARDRPRIIRREKLKSSFQEVA